MILNVLGCIVFGILTILFFALANAISKIPKQVWKEIQSGQRPISDLMKFR